MAYLTLISRTSRSVTLRVDGLNPSSTYVWVDCGVTGMGASPNLRTLPTNSSGQSNTFTQTGLQPATFYTTFWTARTSQNSASGSGSFTTPSEGGGGNPDPPPPTPTYPRPSNWSWNNLYSGGSINVTAAEWNNFCHRINAFREYYYRSPNYRYSFSSAYRGGVMMASQVNEARHAIAQMVPRVGVPSPVYVGEPMTASYLNGLRNSLNSV